MKTTVSEKGQVTIPGRLRRRLGISRGTVLRVSEEDGRLVFEKVVEQDPVALAFGLLAGTGLSTDEALARLRDGDQE